MRFPKYVLDAFDISIAIWDIRARGYLLDHDTIGCPLCEVAESSTGDCTRLCPIRCITKKGSCDGISYWSWNDHDDSPENNKVARKICNELKEIRKQCTQKK